MDEGSGESNANAYSDIAIRYRDVNTGKVSEFSPYRIVFDRDQVGLNRFMVKYFG